MADLQRFMGRMRDHTDSPAGLVELLEEHRTRLRGEVTKLNLALDVLDDKITYYGKQAAQKK